jgi:hypothetical protein
VVPNCQREDATPLERLPESEKEMVSIRTRTPRKRSKTMGGGKTQRSTTDELDRSFSYPLHVRPDRCALLTNMLDR